MSVAWFDSVTLTVECAFSTAPLAVTPTWTDISAYVMGIDLIQGGRATGLDQFAPGTLRLTLNNSDRRFDPLYSSGAYYPNVLPRKKIRVRATYSAVTYDLWCGYVDGWPTTYEPSNTLAICNVNATDGFKILARARLPITGVAVGAQETVAARIGRLLDYAAWPAADRTLDADSPTLIALVPNGQTVQSEMYAAANGDLGQLFITPDGKFVYRGHRWQLGNNLTASATFGDAAGELPYADLTPTFDDAQIFNRCTATATVGPLATATTYDVSDATSITAYGESNRALGQSQVYNSDVMQNTVEWVVARYKDAVLRVDQVMVTPRSSAASLFPVILAAQVGTRWTLKRRPQNVGSAISQDVIVESVAHRIGLATWESTFMLSQSPETSAGLKYWQMGVSKWTTGTPSAIWA